MKHWCTLSLMALLIAGMRNASAQQPVFTATFEMTQTIKSDLPADLAGPMAGQGMVMKCQGWIKGKQARMEMTVQSLGLQMTTLFSDGWLYTLMGPNMGFKIKLPPQMAEQVDQTALLADPATREQILAKMKAQKVGTETVQVGTDPVTEVVCDVYDFTGVLQGMNLNLGSLGGGMPTGNLLQDAGGKLWLNQKTGLPVKTVAQMPALKMTTIVEYSSFKTGVEIPDTQFAVPQDNQLQDLTTMFQGILESMTQGTTPPPQ